MEAETFRDARLAAMPITPLSDIGRFAGTGTLVRVKASMDVRPAISVGTDQSVSFLAVRETHEEGRSHVVVMDDAYWTPDGFYVREGETKVRIETEDRLVDDRFLPVAASGLIRKGALPADVEAAFAPHFKKLHRHEGRTVAVLTIPNDARVTVIGRVEMREGQPVLRRPRLRYLGIDVGRLIVSPFSDAVLNQTLLRTAWAGKIANGLVLVTIAGTILLLVILGRREKRRAEAGNASKG